MSGPAPPKTPKVKTTIKIMCVRYTTVLAFLIVGHPFPSETLLEQSRKMPHDASAQNERCWSGLKRKQPAKPRSNAMIGQVAERARSFLDLNPRHIPKAT